MKAFSLITLILLLCGYPSPHGGGIQDVERLYLAWMNNLTQDLDTSHNTSALLQCYVAKDVIDRLALIDSLYEQEVLSSDYFMYVQDYDPGWTPLLWVEPAHPFFGDEKAEI